MSVPPNPKFAEEFVQFMNESCSAFHAVEACTSRLLAAGFTQIAEADAWNLTPGGKYFFTRNTTTLLAFTVGGKYAPGNGYTVLGAHTDSPCLKIKPVTCSTKGDALVLNTQPYGGGLWHTWFDRDLGIAGRLVLRNADGTLTSKLVRIDSPVARIPNLAIHLTRGTAERDSFAPNLHEHCKCILTMDPASMKFDSDEVPADVKERLHPLLVKMLADAAGVEMANIVDMEVQLIDAQPSAIGGAANELIFSGRLDNLCSTYQCLRALIDTAADADALANHPNVCMTMLFDHEEVGSSSCTGAGSSLFMDTLRLINQCLTDGSHMTLMRSLRKSLVVSVDMAHALHPNYASKHDPVMAPHINDGIVIKHNSNQRYATNAISASLFREMAKRGGAKVQEFTVRADQGCGSTVGPIIATLSGILTIDVGTPQFSMHSIREMMGAHDAHGGYLTFKSVLQYHYQVSTPADTV